MKRRRFITNIINHCYQRTADKGVLFYSYGDCLEYFTLYCKYARKHDIQVYSLCLMPDHIHDAIAAKNVRGVESFKRDVNTRFACSYNKRCGLKGPLLESPFGSSVKLGAKKARNTIIYVGNNPVERQLVTQAEEYRWNFIAYATSDHPYSEKLIVRNARWPLQKAIKEVKSCYKAGKHLAYARILRMFRPLNASERQQLTDFIIVTYNVIDYSYVIKLFDGSYDNLLTALHSTTGHEYDLNEIFVGKTDKPYYQMCSILMQEAGLSDIHNLLSWGLPKKRKSFQLLRKSTNFLPQQIAKYLHLCL